MMFFTFHSFQRDPELLHRRYKIAFDSFSFPAYAVSTGTIAHPIPPSIRTRGGFDVGHSVLPLKKKKKRRIMARKNISLCVDGSQSVALWTTQEPLDRFTFCTLDRFMTKKKKKRGEGRYARRVMSTFVRPKT